MHLYIVLWVQVLVIIIGVSYMNMNMHVLVGLSPTRSRQLIFLWKSECLYIRRAVLSPLEFQ